MSLLIIPFRAAHYPRLPSAETSRQSGLSSYGRAHAHNSRARSSDAQDAIERSKHYSGQKGGGCFSFFAAEIWIRLLLNVALRIELLEVCPQVFCLLFVLDAGEYHFGARNSSL